MAGDKEKGLGGLAKKWLKAQADELLARDRHERADAAVRESQAEHELREKASEEAFLTAVPGMRDLKERAEANELRREQERDAKRHADISARPLAGIGLALSGDLVGSWAGQLPAEVEVQDVGGDPEAWGDLEARQDLWVNIEPVPGAEPLVSGLPLLRWTFRIPRWQGAGTYDLAATWRDIGDDAFDGTDWSFDLGGDDSYYWWYEAGASTIEATGDGGRQLKIHLAMDSSGGSIVVTAEVNLPPISAEP